MSSADAARKHVLCTGIAVLDMVFRVPHFSLANLLQDDPVALNLVLVTIVRVLSHRLRRTNELVGSVEKLSEWLAGSLV